MAKGVVLLFDCIRLELLWVDGPEQALVPIISNIAINLMKWRS